MVETMAALENPSGSQPIPTRIAISIPRARTWGAAIIRFCADDRSIAPADAPAT